MRRPGTSSVPQMASPWCGTAAAAPGSSDRQPDLRLLSRGKKVLAHGATAPLAEGVEGLHGEVMVLFGGELRDGDRRDHPDTRGPAPAGEAGGGGGSAWGRTVEPSRRQRPGRRSRSMIGQSAAFESEHRLCLAIQPRPGSPQSSRPRRRGTARGPGRRMSMITDRRSRSARSTIAVPSRHASASSKESNTRPASWVTRSAILSVSVCVIVAPRSSAGARVPLEGCGVRGPRRRRPAERCRRCCRCRQSGLW